MSALLLLAGLAAVALGGYFLGVGVGATAATEAYLRVLASEPLPETGGASATWSDVAVKRLVSALEATEVDCDDCHRAPAQHDAHWPPAKGDQLLCDDCRWNALAAGAALEEL